jgi:hypothetical protein
MTAESRLIHALRALPLGVNSGETGKSSTSLFRVEARCDRAAETFVHIGDVMDPAIISALSGLMGAAIGGATSASTSMFSERIKVKRNAVHSSWLRREHLYNEFIAVTAKHLADALSHESDDPGALMELYALVAKIKLISPQSVVAAAEAVTVHVQKTYEAPNRSLRQLNFFSASTDADPLIAFSEACRIDLDISRESMLR